MKRSTVLCLILYFTTVLSAQDSRAQDYLRWGLPEGALLRLSKGDVLEVAWSPDGTRLAVGNSLGIWLYDAQTGAEVSLLTGHTSRVSCLVFSRDGMTLASGSHDHTVRLWDVASGAGETHLHRTYRLGQFGGIFAGWDDAGQRQQ